MVRARRIGKTGAVAIAGVVAVGMFAAVAFGSLGTGFTPTTLATATVPGKIRVKGDGIKFWTRGPTDVRVQRIDIAPGGVSGWHHHPGIVIVSVAAGEVIFQNADCSATTYGPGLPAGSAFIESGDDAGQASSILGATVYATYVAPQASPSVFRIEDEAQPQPCVPPAHHKHNHADVGSESHVHR
jgi:hypothetical protein